MKMTINYPNGLPVLKGDLVWWDEGLQVGYVRKVCSKDLPCESDGHIVIGSPPYHVSNLEGLVLPRSLFEDEGVCKLSEGEAAQYFLAEELALKQVSIPSVGSYGVKVFYDQDGKADWHFKFDGLAQKEVVVKRIEFEERKKGRGV